MNKKASLGFGSPSKKREDYIIQSKQIRSNATTIPQYGGPFLDENKVPTLAELRVAVDDIEQIDSQMGATMRATFIVYRQSIQYEDELTPNGKFSGKKVQIRDLEKHIFLIDLISEYQKTNADV